MPAITVYGFVHSIANGLVTITRNNDDANKVFVSSTDVVLTPDMSVPRRAAIQMDKGLAMAYGLYRESSGQPGISAAGREALRKADSAVTQPSNSDLDVKLDANELQPDSENQPSAADMAARLVPRS